MAQSNELLYILIMRFADRTQIPKNKIWIAEPNTNPFDTRVMQAYKLLGKDA